MARGNVTEAWPPGFTSPTDAGNRIARLRCRQTKSRGLRGVLGDPLIVSGRPSSTPRQRVVLRHQGLNQLELFPGRSSVARQAASPDISADSPTATRLCPSHAALARLPGNLRSTHPRSHIPLRSGSACRPRREPDSRKQLSYVFFPSIADHEPSANSGHLPKVR